MDETEQEQYERACGIGSLMILGVGLFVVVAMVIMTAVWSWRSCIPQ